MRIIALVLVVCACGAPDRDPKWKAAGATEPRKGGTLHVATKDQIKSLDPTIAFEEVSTYAEQPLFATLVTYGDANANQGTTLMPDLAERWEIDADGVTYRFFLRDKLVYADGTPIVAGDFKYSLERALRTPDSPFWPFLVDVIGASDVIESRATDCAGIVAVSDRELQIRLVRPSPSFVFILTMKFATPQRADWVARWGDQLRRHPLASGPFILDGWDEGTKISLVPNTHYWDPSRPYLAKIEMLENIPRDTQFLMFERGELDTAERLSAPDYVWIMDQPAWRPYLHQRALMQAFGARMNVTKKPFNDRRVRQALNYALDKSHTVKLLNNAAVPSHGILPPGLLGRDDTIEPYRHDPAEARRLLAEAGVAPGTELTYVTQNDEQGETLAASLKGDLEEVGFVVNVQLVSFATLSTISGSVTGPDFSIASWIGDYPDPTNFLDTKFHSRAIADENATNDTRYSNPELDALLDAARGELDPAKRIAMYKRAERIIYDDAPWIFDYHPMTTEVTQPYVKGFELHPIWVRDYTHTWLDLDANGERVPQ